MGILPLASPPAIDNAGDESAHFRNGMRRERVLESPRRSRALRCMACEFARLRGPTWRMLDPSSHSLQQDSIEHNKLPFAYHDGLVTSVLRTNRIYSGRTPLRVAVGGTSMGTGLHKI